MSFGPKHGGGLSPKEKRFVEEYLIDLNATKAAERAGAPSNSAKQRGYELLQKPDVAAAIEEAQRARSDRTKVTQDMVLQELARVAFASLADVTNWGVKEVAIGYDDEGRRLAAEDIGMAVKVEYVPQPFVEPVDRDELMPEVRAAVAEVSLGREGFKIKMHDKIGALDKIARHLGMYKDKVEHSGTVTIRKGLEAFYGGGADESEAES